jgi:hypothetical protein
MCVSLRALRRHSACLRRCPSPRFAVERNAGATIVGSKNGAHIAVRGKEYKLDAILGRDEELIASDCV